MSHNVTLSQPRDSIGFDCVCLFALFGPASFDSGVLPLAPIRNPVLPLLSILTAHSPPSAPHSLISTARLLFRTILVKAINGLQRLEP